MQSIAAENNLSETAFVLQQGDTFGIRWFTPVAEVPLCGHATLAAAHVLFNHEKIGMDEIVFKSSLYSLTVKYEGSILMMDFPRSDIWQVPFNDSLDCFNVTVEEAWRSENEYMLILQSEDAVRNAKCDLKKASQIDLHGLIITARATTDADFVSRYFTPKFGIDEDPVTGSTHTLLVPYWHGILSKSEFTALQVSARGGKLICRLAGDRIKIGGNAVTFFAGEIFI